MPWALGPADGRYVLREGPGSAGIRHVVVVASGPLAAPARSSPRFAGRVDSPTVTIGRATVIDARGPLADAEAAASWLAAAGDAELTDALRALARLLHAQRLATADPAMPAVTSARLAAARVGWGDGETVAAGRWSQARELDLGGARRRRGGAIGRGDGGSRRRASAAEGRLAALLAGRQDPLACETLALRARLDLDEGRPREAALQLLVALDAALAELPSEPEAVALSPRIADLRERRAEVGAAAQQALAGTPSAAARELVADTVAQLQAALAARAVSAR